MHFIWQATLQDKKPGKSGVRMRKELNRALCDASERLEKATLSGLTSGQMETRDIGGCVVVCFCEPEKPRFGLESKDSVAGC